MDVVILFLMKFSVTSYLCILAASPLASRGFTPRGDKKIKLKFVKVSRKSPAKKRTKEIFCNLGDFFVFGGVGGVPPPKKIALNHHRTSRYNP